MAKNPLFKLRDYGQVIWFDTLSRRLIKSGELQNLIDEYAVVGVTSNPTIFQKAISSETDYDEDIYRLAKEGKSELFIYETLTTDDVRNACDVLWPIYTQTHHVDGRVSIEVNPHLAFNTEGTMEEVRRLWGKVGRPNLMVKIPGTHEGVPAIEEMLYEGININVTLLFAVSMYEKVMEAYLKALERRVAEGKSIDNIHSVASFFVSRVDTMVDKELEAKIQASNNAAEQERLKNLMGKAAIANTKVAYEAFERVFSGPRWETLKAKGANLQRPLWASTSTKNPAYPDTMYVTELVARHTVNTVPEVTLRAFAEHGVVRSLTIEEDVEGAHRVLQALSEAGIDFQDIVEHRLVEEGVKLFADSYDKLIAELRKKRDAFISQRVEWQAQ